MKIIEKCKDIEGEISRKNRELVEFKNNSEK